MRKETNINNAIILRTIIVLKNDLGGRFEATRIFEGNFSEEKEDFERLSVCVSAKLLGKVSVLDLKATKMNIILLEPG